MSMRDVQEKAFALSEQFKDRPLYESLTTADGLAITSLIAELAGATSSTTDPRLYAPPSTNPWANQ